MIARVATLAMTLAIISGVKARMEKSCRMTSSVNRTPPMGALKIALMPGRRAAADQDRHVVARDTEELPDARRDRRADLHDRAFGAGRAARADRDAGGDDLLDRDDRPHEPLAS